jgi:hypothetical protein
MSTLAGRSVNQGQGVAWLVGWSRTSLHGGVLISNPKEYARDGANPMELVYGNNDVGSSANPGQLLPITGGIHGNSFPSGGQEDAMWREIESNRPPTGSNFVFTIIVSTNIDVCV